MEPIFNKALLLLLLLSFLLLLLLLLLLFLLLIIDHNLPIFYQLYAIQFSVF